MQKNITPLVSSVEKVVAAHRAILADAEAKAAAERDALAATQAADKAALEPVAQAAADLANKLTELTSKRVELLEELRIGRRQLTGQQGIAGEFKELAFRNFGHPYAEGNPGVFLQLLQNRPHGLLALLVVPWLETWLTEKQEALEATENQIAELAQSAKAPAK
jgi:hypothetical protein